MWITHGKNDSRVRRQVVGDVGLHLQLGAVRRSKVGDSLELSSYQASAQGELCQQLSRREEVKHDEYSESGYSVVPVSLLLE